MHVDLLLSQRGHTRDQRDVARAAPAFDDLNGVGVVFLWLDCDRWARGRFRRREQGSQGPKDDDLDPTEERGGERERESPTPHSPRAQQPHTHTRPHTHTFISRAHTNCRTVESVVAELRRSMRQRRGCSTNCVGCIDSSKPRSSSSIAACEQRRRRRGSNFLKTKIKNGNIFYTSQEQMG